MDTMETATAQNQGETILELKISEIQPNPFQPRTHFDPGPAGRTGQLYSGIWCAAAGNCAYGGGQVPAGKR